MYAQLESRGGRITDPKFKLQGKRVKTCLRSAEPLKEALPRLQGMGWPVWRPGRRQGQVLAWAPHYHHACMQSMERQAFQPTVTKTRLAGCQSLSTFVLLGCGELEQGSDCSVLLPVGSTLVGQTMHCRGRC
jgi:hypothetical protein